MADGEPLVEPPSALAAEETSLADGVVDGVVEVDSALR